MWYIWAIKIFCTNSYCMPFHFDSTNTWLLIWKCLIIQNVNVLDRNQVLWQIDYYWLQCCFYTIFYPGLPWIFLYPISSSKNKPCTLFRDSYPHVPVIPIYIICIGWTSYIYVVFTNTEACCHYIFDVFRIYVIWLFYIIANQKRHCR